MLSCEGDSLLSFSWSVATENEDIFLSYMYCMCISIAHVIQVSIK